MMLPMKKTALALRHLAFEDLGLIEPLLRERGFEVRYHEAGVDDFAAVDLDAVDLLIALGGPISVEDDANYPWLPDEVALVKRRLDSGRPLLGLCLGAQLMARALGAAVRPMGVKEIANLMGIKWFTVNDHIKSIYKKLNVSSRAEAAVLASKQGLV